MRGVRLFSFLGIPAMAGLCLIGLLSSPAAAQDVTYAAIDDVLNHGSVGGIQAYSLGTRTCNIHPTGSLAWINNGTPGVGFDMYRLSGGRLVQIGMSWVKHACCVSNSNNALCEGTCSGTGFGLRPKCMDTYSASWNSGQGRLGPRSGINAWTSSFAGLPGGSGNAIFRRLQVQVTDLQTAGAQYFVGGTYVCSEEGMQPTQRNNSSYRRVTVNQTNFNLSLMDTTVRYVPAIQAWRDHGLGPNMVDPSVTVAFIDVPSEGRYWYAHKVTNLGGGQYRYDYGVFNLNSDRNGGSMSVPIPPGTLVTNVGHHKPFHHSGEPASFNDNWTSSVTSTSVSWSTPQTFSQNANSSALRWGTMHTYWFTANRPPAAGTATLGLFKPHTPQSVVMNVAVPQGCLSQTGDMNSDTKRDGDDIEPFVGCMINGSYPGTDCACADMNSDGAVDSDDEYLFVKALILE